MTKKKKIKKDLKKKKREKKTRKMTKLMNSINTYIKDIWIIRSVSIWSTGAKGLIFFKWKRMCLRID